MSLDALQQRMGYVFLDVALLETALTHASHAHEQGGEHNERLEFLGDAVLQLAASALVSRRFPKAREGELSRLRSRLVNTRALAEIARSLGLGPLLRLGIGEDDSGGREREGVLADATEAILGAVFLEGGYEAAADVAQSWVRDRLKVLDDRRVDLQWKDPKSALQELTQRHDRATPFYTTVARTGPAHDPCYTVAVSIHRRGEADPVVLGEAEGRSIKRASRAAATAALENYGKRP
jgi:ribonuclease-3